MHAVEQKGRTLGHNRADRWDWQQDRPAAVAGPCVEVAASMAVAGIDEVLERAVAAQAETAGRQESVGSTAVRILQPAEGWGTVMV